MVCERSRVWGGLIGIGLVFGLGAPAHADLYRWVDAKGVVNYSNIPPADVQAKRIPDTQPTVSVIPPPDNQAEVRRALREAELLRRIEALEDEIAAARRASAPVVVYPVPAEPVFTYSTSLVYPYPIYSWPVTKPFFGGHRFKPGWGGVPGRPGGRPPVAAPHGRPSGLSVRARF